MRLLLINPNNPAVTLVKNNQNPWNRYRVWKPLGLLVLAGQTPAEWDITVVDENTGMPDYDLMDPPDLVGITAFTSQATRACEIAAKWRARGVPVVMGGIHATMRLEEAIGASGLGGDGRSGGHLAPGSPGRSAAYPEAALHRVAAWQPDTHSHRPP